MSGIFLITLCGIGVCGSIYLMFGEKLWDFGLSIGDLVANKFAIMEKKK